jgi:hypothetical protein
MKKKLFIILVTVMFLCAYTLNFIENIKIAETTNNRNLQYNTWSEVTKNTNLFVNVKTRDFLIARNQNDAYEYNSATFYKYTKKRLAYFYNTSTIYPEIASCSLLDKCLLPNPKQISITKLGTLNRIDNPTTSDAKSDWVVNNMLSTEINLSSVWATDLINLTQDIIFVYLAKFDEKSENAFIDTSTFRSFLIAKRENSISPKFGEICLLKSKSNSANFDSAYYITEWLIPGQKSFEEQKQSSLINYVDTNVGTC